jgi:putative endonuclease
LTSNNKKGFTQQHFIGHYVYLLKSLDFDEYYIGSTNDLEKRLAEHNDGTSFHTKKFAPWVLEYYEAYKTEELARKREMALKKHGNAKRGLKARAGVME